MIVRWRIDSESNDLDSSTAENGMSRLAWSRVAQWLPSRDMGSKPALVVFSTAGCSTFDKSLIPTSLTDIMDAHYPLYWTPPLDDKRPNETSWTVFRKDVGDIQNEAVER